MARPKKDDILHRTKNVMVRFTEIEHELISRYAKEAGHPVAVYVRERSLGDVNIHYNVVADIEEVQKLTMHFARIGSNLNQIAAYYNTGGMQSRAMQAEINRCITELHQMREEVIALGGEYGCSKTHRNKKR